MENELPSVSEFPSEKDSKLGLCGLIAFIACMILAGWRVFSQELLSDFMPGVGLTVTVTVMLFFSVIIARKNGYLRLSPFGIVCLFCTEAVAACYTLYGNNLMRLIDLPVVTSFYVYTMFVLTSPDGSAISFRGLVKAAGRFFSNCFRSIPVPFRALSEMKASRKHGRLSTDAALGICIAVVVVPVVCVLLGSADEMFAGIFDGIGKKLTDFDFSVIAKLLFLMIPLGFILFSQVFSPSLREEPRVEGAHVDAAPSVFTATLIGIAAAFLLFGYIQVKYLFLGREAAAMKGGFAEYARSGFFELVGVAFLALIVVQPALALCGDKRVTRILCLIVSVLTEVVVASAFLRMRLYISVYGLTILRVLVLWATMVLGVCFIAAAVKSVKPDIKIFSFAILFIMVSWTLLSLMNPPEIIADHNVSAYQNGTLAHIDKYYLYDLLPASADELDLLAVTSEEGHRVVGADRSYYDDVYAYEWCIEFTKLK